MGGYKVEGCIFGEDGETRVSALLFVSLNDSLDDREYKGADSDFAFDA